MRKLLVYFMSLVGLFACEQRDDPPDRRTLRPQGAEITYEEDDSEPADEDDAGARLSAATPKGKLTFQYMNNETEVFRPSSYTVAMWRSDAEPSATTVPTSKPTYLVVKKTGRSYVRKTVNVGWYVAQYQDVDGGLPGGTFKFQVMESSNGLLCYNENSFSSVHFRGYYLSFGKIKCSWKTVPGNDVTAHLTLTKDGASQPFWLYAEDGTGKYKGQYWFMPTGTYTFSMPGLTNTGSLTIASTGKYPNIKFF